MYAGAQGGHRGGPAGAQELQNFRPTSRLNTCCSAHNLQRQVLASVHYMQASKAATVEGLLARKNSEGPYLRCGRTPAEGKAKKG